LFPGIRRVHFIGIGGIGMSGLAEILLHHGTAVSGSDLHPSPLTDRLAGLGARIFAGHRPEHIGTADVVVYSAAVSSENPELRAARDRGVLAVTRADLLGALVRGHQSIAVAGTHGKTTTTAMIGVTLTAAGVDPTLVIGGVLPALGSNVRVGRGDWMVVEADEYDRSFHTLAPTTAVLTSIDADHLEYYGSLEAIDRAFLTFAHLVPFDRPLAVCADDPGIQRVRLRLRRRLLTYGFSPEAAFRAVDVALEGLSSSATLVIRGQRAGVLRLQRPGRHHILNALAAVAVADMLDIPPAAALDALAGFTGVQRRFEIKGECQGVTVIDDYAHHPAEIQATLSGLSGLPDRRIIAVFQPHLYTRTRDLAAEFGRVLAESRVHRCIVTDVYPSREAPIPGISGEIIVQAARTCGGRHVEYIADRHGVPAALAGGLQPGDILLTMGAGDIYETGERVLRELEKQARPGPAG
jgi:UDP-N-acetylmuramate--alanine ligase